MTDDDVANYLNDHPDFFERHSDLLTAITLPHPHGGRAISLAERQMQALRDKNRTLEIRLADLLRHGSDNDALSERLNAWTRSLLLERNMRRLPETMTSTLGQVFAVPATALRVWEVADDHGDLPCAEPVAVDVITLANQLSVPYLGAPQDKHAKALALLHDAESMQSIALLPLRRGALPEAFGLLVLGSPDPRRFDSRMGTHFLERISEMASAALTRILA